MGVRQLLWAICIGAALCAALPRPSVAESPAGPAEPATEALQHRLADAACYSGAIDGHASEALTKAVAQCPPQEPQLRVETGMHVAPVRRLGVDQDCHLAVTASEDKTVRLWSLPDGRLLRTLRVPISNGNGGKIYAAALASDGRWVATGGWDAESQGKPGHSVFVFDASSGAMIARIGDFAGTIHALAFSRDARWLAVSVSRGQGLHVIDTKTWREVWSDRSLPLDAYAVTFAADGRLFVGADDGKLRLYGAGPRFAKQAEVSTRDAQEPFQMAVDPRGELLAVGFKDVPRVEIYDLASLRWRFSADTGGIEKGNLRSVAFLDGGAKLAAGGTFREHPQQGWKTTLLLFDRAGRPNGEIVTPGSDPISQLSSCGAGAMVSTGDPALGLVDAGGKFAFWRAPVSVDMRGKRGSGFTVSPDGKRVRFSVEIGGQWYVTFDPTAGLAEARGSLEGFAPPLTEGLRLTGWLNQTSPKLFDKTLPLGTGEWSRALAIRIDRTGFALAADYSLRTYDALGKLRWRVASPDVAWGVNVSADGRLVVAAYGDGTIRWYRWSDGKELLALFVNRQNRTWVAWTPSGYYSASVGGENMIGWQLNRGWKQAADFFPAAKFRDTFARPDIVERVLDTLDEAEAARLADAARTLKPPPVPIIETLPPVISILSPGDGAELTDATVKIDFIVRSPSGAPVDAIEALVDGKPVNVRGLAPIDDVRECIRSTRGSGIADGALQGCRGSLTLTVGADVAEIGLFARARDTTSDVARLRVMHARATIPDARKPQLYALVVGISNYANPNYSLEFAAKDAKDFAAALMNQKGGLYGEVNVKLLTDGAASAIAIKDGLDWLTKQVTEHDVGIVYLAGHGELDERNRFYFLAADSDFTRLRATAVAREDVADAITAIPGKALLFLDTCHAGAVVGPTRRSEFDFDSVVNDFARSERGIVVYGASTGRQVSLENPAWGNGAFTKAVVEGLGLPGQKGKADLNGDGTITTSVLDAYVAKRVKELTNGEQSPVMTSTAPDFPLAVAR